MSENIINARSHYYIIIAFTKFGNGDVIERMEWHDLRFDLRSKYDWYFKHRAALLQIKYPRAYIDCRWGNEEPTKKTLSHLLKGRIDARIRKLSEIENKISQAEKQWDQIFPITDHPNYQKAIAKKQRLNHELSEMIFQHRMLDTGSEII